MNKCLLLYSGGLDSTVLLYELVKEGKSVHCVLINYGSKHNEMEHKAALKHIVKFNLTYSLVALTYSCEKLGSALTDKDIAVPSDPTEQHLTVFPYRNTVMLSIASSIAVPMGVKEIYIAANKDDYEVYKDCRSEFFTALNIGFEYGAPGQDNHTRVIAPFLGMTKKDIVQAAKAYGFPFEDTYSCYQGGEQPCGECGPCKLIKEAMK